MPKTKTEQLTWAIASWEEFVKNEEELADFFDKQGTYGNTDAFRVRADSGRRTADALKKELETGIPHCNCHLMPWEDCPSRIKSGVLL